MHYDIMHIHVRKLRGGVLQYLMKNAAEYSRHDASTALACNGAVRRVYIINQ